VPHARWAEVHIVSLLSCVPGARPSTSRLAKLLMYGIPKPIVASLERRVKRRVLGLVSLVASLDHKRLLTAIPFCFFPVKTAELRYPPGKQKARVSVCVSRIPGGRQNERGLSDEVGLRL